MSATFNHVTELSGEVIVLRLVTAGTAQFRRSASAPMPAASPVPCVDGAGLTDGLFCFCGPYTQNRTIAACSKNVRGMTLNQCREAGQFWENRVKRLSFDRMDAAAFDRLKGDSIRVVLRNDALVAMKPPAKPAKSPALGRADAAPFDEAQRVPCLED